MQQRNPFDAFDQPARRGMVIQSGPPADPSKEPMTRAQLVTEQARAANADAQQRAQTRIDNANADAKERDNRDAAADAAAAAAGTKMGPNSQLTGDAYLRAFVPPSQWEVVKSFARGDAGARQGINKTTLPIIQHAMNYDHSFSMANYPARALMTADLASHAAGSMGNYLSALGAVAAHSRLEESAIGGLDNPSGVVGRYGGASLNNYFNNEGAATGSAFHTANQTFADEKVKAILASGPGAVADREAAVKEVQPTMAKDAQYASLRTTARQIYDKYQEQELKYSRVMGGQNIPMPMRQEDAAQLLHLMRLGDDGKEGATPKDIEIPSSWHSRPVRRPPLAVYHRLMAGRVLVLRATTRLVPAAPSQPAIPSRSATPFARLPSATCSATWLHRARSIRRRSAPQMLRWAACRSRRTMSPR